MTTPTDAAVVLVGMHGHGRWHLRNLDRLRRDGAPVRLAGICDTQPPGDDERALAGNVPFAARLDELLDVVRPDVAIICTPIHTHADLTLEAASAGCDVLLEKPPAPTLAEFDRLVSGVTASVRTCQVGFQSLGSHAIDHVRALIADGVIGEVRGIGAAGAWQRDSAYYTRAPWSGRRTLDGAAVVDGALTNPFAHATVTALALDGGRDDEEVYELEVELYRANPIEADDTSCLRFVTVRGTPITVAVTLCSEREIQPYVQVHGTRGRIVLEYRTGRVQIETPDGMEINEHGASDLLENLIAHIQDPEIPLLAPLAMMRPFMQVIEAVRLARDPLEIAPESRLVDTSGRSPRLVVPGVDEAVARSARELMPLSALGLPWTGAAKGDE